MTWSICLTSRCRKKKQPYETEEKGADHQSVTRLNENNVLP